MIRDVFNFLRKGFFLDVGAADGVNLSNSYALEEYYEWSGICVEGDSQTHEVLKRNRRATCVNACIDSTSRDAIFTTEKGLYGGIVDADTDNKSLVQAGAQGVAVRTQKLEDVLKANNAPKVINYLSLDIEGAEERALREFPFSDWTFLCATIERPTPVLREVLSRNGYFLVAEQPGLDCFYVHESMADKYLRRALDRSERQCLPLGERIGKELSDCLKRGLRASLDRI